MDITTLGIDLAKNTFHLHGVNAKGETVIQKRLSRDQLSAFVANLPPCLIGMEACGGSNYWARKFQSFGGPRKDESFLKLQTLLKPFGIKRYYTDHWGAYTRHIDPNNHFPGKRNTQKIERKHLVS